MQLHLSEGTSGGTIVMWKEGIIQMDDHLLGAFNVFVKFHNVADNFIWLFTFVYGASVTGYYNQFWKELRDIRILFDDPWLLEGILMQFFWQMKETLRVVHWVIENLSKLLLTGFL